MSNGNGHSWTKFFWRDWSADKALHPCSLAAKGFWIEMLCIMHDGTPVGHLTLGGKQASIRQMAANAYCSEREATKLLAELEVAGVFSRDEHGTIYCRRMVKDAAASEAGREHIAKRWNGHGPNSPPNRGPNGKASSQPTRDPITKNLEAESEAEKKAPPVGPHGVGTGTPAEPGPPPARRADGSNPRAVGQNPRAVGTNPRAKPPLNAFHDMARRMDAELAERGVTIEGTAENVEHFDAWLLRLRDGSNG